MKSIVALTLLTMLSLSACATSGRPVPQPTVTPNQFCLIAKPIYLSSDDKLTTATLRAVIALNEKGQELCGWRPPA